MTPSVSTMRGLACGALLVLLAGCATSAGKQPAPEAAVPFTEHTIAMLGDLQFGMRRANIVLLRPYIDDENSPRVEEFRTTWDEVTLILRAVVAYSIQLVDIMDATAPNDPIGALANSVEQMVEIMATQPRAQIYMSNYPFDLYLAEIREQETMLEALAAAQPAVDAIAGVVSRMLTRAREDVEAATGEISAELHQDHAAVTRYLSHMRRRQSTLLTQLRQLDAVRNGSAAELRALIDADPLLKERFGEVSRVDPETIEGIENVLHERLGRMDLLREHLDPDFQLFQAQQRELREVQDVAFDSLRRAQISVLLWSRAHEQVATGKSGGFGVSQLTSAILKYAL